MFKTLAKILHTDEENAIIATVAASAATAVAATATGAVIVAVKLIKK